MAGHSAELSAIPGNSREAAVTGGLVTSLAAVIAERAAAGPARAPSPSEGMAAITLSVTSWTNVSDLVVLDTNFYIHHPVKLEEADIATAADLGSTRAHVLVPMVVIDELDGLKHSKQEARGRAGYAVAVLDRVFKDGTVGRLHGDDNTVTAAGLVGQGEVTMELLPDPPGHTRLPINDDEIVDRALAVQSLAGRDVTLVTYDTGMSTRARIAGLKAVKIPMNFREKPK